MSPVTIIIKILAVTTFENTLSYSHSRKADDNNSTYILVVIYRTRQ